MQWEILILTFIFGCNVHNILLQNLQSEYTSLSNKAQENDLSLQVCYITTVFVNCLSSFQFYCLDIKLVTFMKCWISMLADECSLVWSSEFYSNCKIKQKLTALSSTFHCLVLYAPFRSRISRYCPAWLENCGKCSCLQPYLSISIFLKLFSFVIFFSTHCYDNYFQQRMFNIVVITASTTLRFDYFCHSTYVLY